MRFFNFYEKLILRTFLIFLHKFTIAWRLKIDRLKWLSGWKTFFWSFCTTQSPKQSLNENVLVLSKIIVQKVSNWLIDFIGENFYFESFGPKRAWNGSHIFPIVAKSQCMELFRYYALSYRSINAWSWLNWPNFRAKTESF